MKVDYLIVGQGIAGTVLAHTLAKYQKRVAVVADSQLPTSSQVAAGLYNPLTGRKLVKTWLADELFPFLSTFYKALEQLLQTNFLHEKRIYRPFRSTEEQNDWLNKSYQEGYQPYMDTDVSDEAYTSYIYNPYGGFETKQAGYLALPTLLKASKAYWQQKEAYIEAHFNYEALNLENTLVKWKAIEASRIIFCEGVGALQNPYFRYLPFRPVKGEVISTNIVGYQLPHIVNQGISILPAVKDKVKVASTYDWRSVKPAIWDPQNWTATEAAKEELVQKAQKILKQPLAVITQQAGIRPATKSRRPFIGLHPQYP
ncbi:MAG: FAD-dependent oxidoreductase, partial [Bacteroidota bacterium]